MANSWVEVTIEEIKDSSPYSLSMGPFGSNIKTDNFVLEGVPIIRGVNLKEERFHDDNFVFLTETKADELKSANAFPGDIVFTHRGTLGQVGFIPNNSKFKRYVISQSQMKLRVNPFKADPLYVFYFFRSPQGQQALLANTSTTGVPAISSPLSTLRSLKLPLPPLHIQQKISGILDSIDRKIELNQRINQTLEGIAHALFKYMFIENPDRIGWEKTTLSSFAYITSGKRPEDRKNVQNKEYSIPLYGGGGIMGYTNKPLLNEPILLTGRVGTLGLVFRISTPCWASDNTLVLRPKKTEDYEFLYFQLLHTDILNLNRGSTQPLLTQTDLQKTIVKNPSKGLISIFHHNVSSIFDLLESNNKESKNLQLLRDILLPRLMRGENLIND